MDFFSRARPFFLSFVESLARTLLARALSSFLLALSVSVLLLSVFFYFFFPSWVLQFSGFNVSSISTPLKVVIIKGLMLLCFSWIIPCYCIMLPFKIRFVNQNLSSVSKRYFFIIVKPRSYFMLQNLSSVECYWWHRIVIRNILSMEYKISLDRRKFLDNL